MRRLGDQPPDEQCDRCRRTVCGENRAREIPAALDLELSTHVRQKGDEVKRRCGEQGRQRHTLDSDQVRQEHAQSEVQAGFGDSGQCRKAALPVPSSIVTPVSISTQTVTAAHRYGHGAPPSKSVPTHTSIIGPARIASVSASGAITPRIKRVPVRKLARRPAAPPVRRAPRNAGRTCPRPAGQAARGRARAAVRPRTGLAGRSEDEPDNDRVDPADDDVGGVLDPVPDRKSRKGSQEVAMRTARRDAEPGNEASREDVAPCLAGQAHRCGCDPQRHEAAAEHDHDRHCGRLDDRAYGQGRIHEVESLETDQGPAEGRAREAHGEVENNHRDEDRDEVRRPSETPNRSGNTTARPRPRTRATIPEPVRNQNAVAIDPRSRS